MTDDLGPRGGRPVLAQSADRGSPELLVVADASAVAVAAAERFQRAVAGAIARRGRADVALTGGSNAPGLYRRLAEPAIAASIDWARVHLWWGDDRFVGRADPLSNVEPFDRILLARVAAAASGGGAAPARPGGPGPAADTVHPFPVDDAVSRGLGPEWCAAEYARSVAAAVPDRDGWPAFDLVFVGIGGDGHLLSVFPASPALSSDRIGLGIPAPTHIEPHVPRITLNPAILLAANEVVVISNGADKAAIIARILGGAETPESMPATIARRAGATWIIDQAAAGRL